MKKLIVLVGVAAAAAYGAKKIFSSNEQETNQQFATTNYTSNAYTPQSQDEQAA